MSVVIMEGKLQEAATKLGELLERKNKAYGNAYTKSGDFLRLLYPNGITPDHYDTMLFTLRVFDKQMRIATSKDKLDENPAADIAGYGVLEVVRSANVSPEYEVPNRN